MATNYKKVARRKARKYGLDSGVFIRQIRQESGFNPRAVSPAGARGIAQIMPGTAKAWGVDPMNPRAALDAAAKNMAAYVRKYGSYENALRAYNAGPGAIERSKGYSETNNYVKTILQGKDPGNLNRGGSQNPNNRSRGVSRTRSGAPAATSPFDPGNTPPLSLALMSAAQTPQRPTASPIAAPEFAAGPTLAGAQLESNWAPRAETSPLDDMLAAIRDQGQNLPEISSPSQGPQSKPGPSRRPKTGRYKGQLLEMFYDPGINVDNGKRTNAIGGHGGHVHVAANPRTVVELGRLAQKMGLVVKEHPKFDKVDPVHTKGSFHYSGRAIDVSGDAKKLRAYNRRVARLMRA